MKHPAYDRRFGPMTAAQVVDVLQSTYDGLWYFGVTATKGYATREEAEAVRQRYIRRKVRS